MTNVGDQQQTYMAINQKLIIDGRQYNYAGEPTFVLNDNATSQINPGIGIDTEIAFDVVELHGSTVSPGAYVTLAGE